MFVMEDTRECMLVYQPVTRGIHGEYFPPPNTDLIRKATEQHYRLPQDYHAAIFERQFLRNDYKKYYNTYPWFPDEQALVWAEKALRLRYQPFMMANVLSIEEAIKRIDKTKSPGFPWNTVYKTKQEVIDNELELVMSIIGMIQRREEIVFLFRGKEYRGLYWMASPKGEFRPLEKIINPDPTKRKTRTFLCSEIVTHIVNTALYGEQNDALLEAHRHNLWMQIGMSPFYGGWNRMIQYLRAKGCKKFNCWDFKHCEASLRENILKILYRIRDDCVLHDQESMALFDFAWMQNCYSLVIDVDGFLNQMFGNNPSGALNTLDDNCLAVELVIIYTLAKHCSSFDELMIKIESHNLTIMGDDTVIPDHEDFKDIQEDCIDLGFNLEPEILHVDIEHVVFLNSGVHLKNGVYYPKANFEKIRANIYYNFKKNSWRLAYVKCCAYRVLAWFYDKERNEAEELIRYIDKHHKNAMKNEQVPELTELSARAAYLPPSQIEFMWSGNESATVEAVFTQSVNNTVKRLPFYPHNTQSFCNLANFALDL
jgi:hypothetical protein